MQIYKRKRRARRLLPVDDWPNWVINVLYTSLGGLGAIFVGFIKAWSDNKRTRVEDKRVGTQDRSNFTEQILSRLATVEQQMQEEREYCDKRMQLMKEDYEGRIDRRDTLILELKERESNREARLIEVERHLNQLEDDQDNRSHF